MSNPYLPIDKQPIQPSNAHKALGTNLSALYWLSYVCAFFTIILAFTLIFGLNAITLVLLVITAAVGLASYLYIRKTSRTLPRLAKTSALLTTALIVIKFVTMLYLERPSTEINQYIEFATIGFLIPLILFQSYVAFGNQNGKALMLGIYICTLFGSLPYLFGFSQYTQNEFMSSLLIFILCVTTSFIFIYIGAFNLLRKENSEKNTALLEFNYKDKLTNFANRTAFTEFLEQKYKDLSEENKFESYSLVLVDIDNFKRINDSYGQAVGDNCLKVIAKRIQHFTLASDTFLARTDGDEFTLCIPSSDNLYLESFCQQLSQKLEEPISLGLYNLNLSYSIAGCLFPMKDENLDVMLKKLAWTLNRAKQKNQSVCIYTPELDKDLVYQERIEKELSSAINNGELQLHYQPLLDLKTGEIKSAEALLRWQNNHLGQVSPADFIPIAETSGLILSLGHWVIQTACLQLKHWSDIGCDFSVAINISTAQFNQEHLVRDIQDALANHQLDPEKLNLEITESQVVDKYGLHQLTELKQLGCTIKLDDFGTGYSSLSVVNSLPLNELKIDKSFIQHLDDQYDSQEWMTVKTIIVLAHNFNLKVVAEGIETVEQLEHLQHLGCDYAQGFYIAKPMPAENLYKQFMLDSKAMHYSSKVNQVQPHSRN